jgi:PAS domain S-box-containing protein
MRGRLISWNSPLVRYTAALGAVGMGLLVRLALDAWVGPGLPTYITFYPAVMAVALLAGFGPGLVATAVAALAADYWLLPPAGFGIENAVDAVGIAFFLGMGLFMSLVAEFYRHARLKAAAYDREQALRETRRQNQFLANILEQSSQPFAIGYPDGRLGLLNHAFAELTGYTAAELRAMDWGTTLTPPEWREAERQKLEELHRTDQPARYEKEYLRKDGRRVPIELLVHLVRDAEGKADYYYSFVTDITERKRAEEATRRHAEELRATNAELARFNQAMVSRELRMVELKKEVNTLCAQFGQAPRYWPQDGPPPPETPGAQ